MLGLSHLLTIGNKGNKLGDQPWSLPARALPVGSDNAQGIMQ
jgi:hypothetical protein